MSLRSEAPADWYKNIKVTFNNFAEGLETVVSVDAEGVAKAELIPGIYNVMASTDKKQEHSHRKYIINGLAQNVALTKDVTAITKENTISINPVMDSPLCIREMYYAGSEGGYFRDQFYEIYNNSGSVQYLDGVHFANLYPGTATTKLPIWPEEDGDNYAYGDRVWKFPGNGTDYPLQPGESCIISQFAANHQLEQYNPQSPVDGSSSEFEFNMNNANFPDQPAYDMEHVFYNGKAEMGTIPQYLTAVFGGAYVIFRVPEGETGIR